MASLELAYLHEIGKVRDSAPMVLAALRQSIGLEIIDTSLTEVVHAAVGLTWTRNPFERITAAQAIVANAPLVTANRTILANLPLARWN